MGRNNCSFYWVLFNKSIDSVHKVSLNDSSTNLGSQDQLPNLIIQLN